MRGAFISASWRIIAKCPAFAHSLRSDNGRGDTGSFYNPEAENRAIPTEFLKVSHSPACNGLSQLIR
jgi:hypothetical protein